VAKVIEEQDLAPVARKLAAGDHSGAVETCAELVLAIVSGHPLVGAVGGPLVRRLAAVLANGYVDATTKRLLEAERVWDDAEAKAGWLREQLVLAVQPLLEARDERDDERFLQKLRYIDRNVASAAMLEQVLQELRALREHVETRQPPRQTGVSSTSSAGGASRLGPAQLRMWMVDALSPEELEVFVADVLPESGGLRRIVAATHPHEYQVFKVVEYCQRRGYSGLLEARLVALLGPAPADRGGT